MRLTFPRTLGFATITATAVLAFAGAATAGKIIPAADPVCTPDGQTVYTFTVTNTAPVDVTGPNGPIDVGDDHTFTGGPGTYSGIWWNPNTTERVVPRDVWGTYEITVPALPADQCAPTTTTTAPPTTVATVTTPPAQIDQATTAPVTIPPQQTSACEQERDEGNDICNLGTPPPAIDQGQRLPETGRNTGEVLTAAGALTALGLFALWYRRYGRRPTVLGA